MTCSLWPSATAALLRLYDGEKPLSAKRPTVSHHGTARAASDAILAPRR